ncbi:MAG: malate synthase A [Thermaerobacter sp.]|nr:malate synthase A [Thermaerobacter sp.]
MNAQYDGVLTTEAVEFLAALHRQFDTARRGLLARRQEVQVRIDAGWLPSFPEETRTVREAQWHVAAPPRDLQDRRVEITGPVDRKMVINALNSGAKVFMADFEDANAPTWDNVMQGQINVSEAIERRLAFVGPNGKTYRLNREVATLIVRPRGWHLDEKHILVDGLPLSASLMDFGLFLFRNARSLIGRGSGPYFYLPKLEGYLEARLWADVFAFSEQVLGLAHGTIKATVLIETILASLEMDEILYELRDYAVGLNAGRWDYIFSAIKKFRNHPEMTLPDRSQITMTVPFMRAYTELLVKTCHRRGAHAMGGMAAFIPSRHDPEVNSVALARVQEDKEREAADGCDGTWVAHPDLVPVAMAVFDAHLGSRPNQLDKKRVEVEVRADELLNLAVPNGTITAAGLRNNVRVAIQYLESWLRGNGAVAIFNLMEDAATAEIARAQIWQWVHNRARLDNGEPVTQDLVRRIEREELLAIRQEVGDSPFESGRYREAAELFEAVSLADEFPEFLTLPAYQMLP